MPKLRLPGYLAQHICFELKFFNIYISITKVHIPGKPGYALFISRVDSNR